MGKWCLHASSFIFDRIIIKVAGHQDWHKSSVKFDLGPNQTTHFGVTCPWVTKIAHILTWISLKPVGQSWSNFMCNITGVEERLHKILGQIGSKLWHPWRQKTLIDLWCGKWCLHPFSDVFDPIFFLDKWTAVKFFVSHEELWKCSYCVYSILYCGTVASNI